MAPYKVETKSSIKYLSFPSFVLCYNHLCIISALCLSTWLWWQTLQWMLHMWLFHLWGPIRDIQAPYTARLPSSSDLASKGFFVSRRRRQCRCQCQLCPAVLLTWCQCVISQNIIFSNPILLLHASNLLVKLLININSHFPIIFILVK